MKAEDVLKRMADAYATARTYQDTGEVRTVFLKNKGEGHENRKPFKTLFERPRWFRFEYKDEWGGLRRILCRNEGLARLQDEDLSLNLAIAALTGVSGGSAHRAPALLMPELFKPRLPRPGTLLEGMEEVDGHPCHLLTRRLSPDDGESIWIDAESFLVRKVFSRTDFGAPERRRAIEDARLRDIGIPGSIRPPVRTAASDSFVAESTTTYAPVRDGPIDRALFAAG